NPGNTQAFSVDDHHQYDQYNQGGTYHAGQKADDFRKGERTREEITDLMAGGEAMAHLEAELAQLQAEA
ncbi:hypothetical protein ACWCQQ_45600, partial [Streptomyces sp. NPDC002143]